MKYILDHDYHIHTKLSLCSSDPEQTAEAILNYGLRKGLKQLCITDHYWDETVPGASEWYKIQNTEHIRNVLPLPKNKDVRMFFGCETEMDKFFTVGVSKEHFDKFDFVIIPTSHLHMTGFTIEPYINTAEAVAELYVKRLNALLDKDLPFRKIGFAHPTCDLLFKDHLAVVDCISDSQWKFIFDRMASCGMGVELNMNFLSYSSEDISRVTRPFRIAKAAGCRFYCGSDAHQPADFDNANNSLHALLDYLDLSEEQKFRFPNAMNN